MGKVMSVCVSIRRLIWSYWIWVFVAVIAASLSIVDVYELFSDRSALERILFWLAVVGSGVYAARFVLNQMRRRLGRAAPSQETLYLSLVLTVIYAPPLWAVSFLREAGVAFPFIAANVFFVVLAMSVFCNAIDDYEGATQKPERDRLYQRVPELDAAIVAISSKDHHVELRFDNGAVTRLRMRLSDAIAEMDVTPGVRVHRSHWASISGINCWRSCGSKQVVEMHDGSILPVGGKSRDDLLAAGFRLG